MFEDLRSFLSHLESQHQLLRVKDLVDVKYEIAAGMRKTSDSEGPALLFENVKAYPGWRVLGGLFATRKLVALGLGVPQEQMLERYLTLEDQRIAPEIVSSAPCKEIKWTGDQVDLSKLPIVTHASKDCGPYVTIGVQVGKDPDTGIRNLSIHRMLVLGRDRLSLWAPADHHLGRMILKAEERKKGLEVATAVGVDPAIVVGSQARVPFGIDEFHVAGGLRGAAVKLAKCETIDIEVPAFSEVVIEGSTIPGERVADGPYGEYPGCYSEAKQSPVLKVTAITMRQN
ncbi:MAG: UbiD family decarboxylase, partial [Candidatus Binatia bacterium]